MLKRAKLPRIGQAHNFLVAQFRRCPTTDLEQNTLRIVTCWLTITYLVYMGVLDLSSAIHIPREAIVLYISVTTVLFLSLFVYTEASFWRRIVGMFSDLTGISYILFAADHVGAPLFFVYYWTIVGNGVRWGLKYLYIAMAVSLVEFALVFVFSDYWAAQPQLASGVILGLVIVPLFISRLIRRLNKAMQRADRANQEKTAFLAKTSHELRTPLNGMIGRTDLLLRTKVSKEQWEHVSAINECAEALLAQVNDILDIAKIELGKYEPRADHLSLPRIIRNVCRIVQASAAEKGLHIRLRVELPVPATVIGDEKVVRQVLLNLLDNAVKFTEAGGVTISVSAQALKPWEQVICFKVEDTGVGIPEIGRAKVFDTFVQVDETSTRRHGGSGLGMSISKQLVDTLGGTIDVASEAGGGSSFRVTLPFLPKERKKSDDHASCADALVVADFPDSQDVHEVVEMLESMGWTVRLWSFAQGTPDSVSRAVVILVVAEESISSAEDFIGDISETDKLRLIGVSSPQFIEPLLEMGCMTVLFDPTSDQSGVFSNALRWGMPEDEVIPREWMNVSKLGRILVVDDYASNRQILACVLENAGYEVTAAESGTKAMQYLDGREFDAVLVDYHMPGLSGLDLVEWYRRQDTRPDIPFLILTADATLEARHNCRAAGVAFLIKPIRTAQLLREIARIRASVTGPAVVSATRLENLQAYLGDDVGLAEIGEGFVSETQTKVDQLALLIENKDHASARESVHAIKGAAGFIGAETLEHCCARIEALSVEELIESADTLIHELNTELERVQKRLSSCRPSR